MTDPKAFETNVKYSCWVVCVAKILKVKGSGAEARIEGLFLQWQTHSGEAAKALKERGDPRPPPPPSPGSGKAGVANEWQLWLSRGGVKCDSGQTPSRLTAVPRERGRPGARANRGDKQRWQTEAANRGGKQRRRSSQGAVQQFVRQFSQAGFAGKASGQGAAPPSWLLK